MSAALVAVREAAPLLDTTRIRSLSEAVATDGGAIGGDGQLGSFPGMEDESSKLALLPIPALALSGAYHGSPPRVPADTGFHPRQFWRCKPGHR
jgi:hypothetical protein